MRTTAWMLAGALALPTAAWSVDTDAAAGASWARWQGRVSLTVNSSPWRLGADAAPVSRLDSASVMGDYYFGRSLASPSLLGGFRATSGLVFGSRSSLLTAGTANGSVLSIGRTTGAAHLPNLIEPGADNGTQPYLGVGYTGLAPRSGWSFSADLGLLARGNAASFGRVATQNQSLDDAVRQLRMTPLVQLGASYSF